ncbi:putative hydrolase or acyltransferase of alpha/beta superfamily [Hyella patelloides LEGE 07179]|uniref:Putative hydrolase or acyltransferase of alpha/beta superfamily n=1 Tax=Hyella patelloides LEGE 07179 TaxID=945734 RepID=A0A563VSZ5_9CYAN|nr:alpha/beta fold hydrolase [Hyella patelloides]VEP14502.1 putative hydrolase or acyltransferase of alpha/beta superfamily [Hyella patelloides LEGE 07179]
MQVTSLETSPSIPGNYWQWRGHQIYYVKAGEQSGNKPPLLLVHGFGASTDHWRKNIAQLQKEFQVWAIDLLGFGRSEKPALEYSGSLWCEQLHDFITEMIGQPTVLAGNSLGGYASLCVAGQRPQSVAGLILVNSAGPFSGSNPVKKNSLQQTIGKLTRALLLQPLPSFLLFQYVRRKSMIRKTLKQVYLDHSAISDRLVDEIYRPSCDKGASQVFAAVFKTPPGAKVDELLQQMTCPLLLIWGEGDPWMNSREKGAQFRQYYPNLTEHFVNAGHCPHDEVPEQVNELISTWVLSF